ncbi:MAG TPA: hypothetical protein PLP29_15410 [Candidatus Ozemobacteraceae bacterium]|nr:hypothetical protein [Candidatus Ozemobacteraceae bacterium]
MSLSHLGIRTEPVFDAVCPTDDRRFPVVRRVVSHAARSLFSGKLLFPVATAGKEGQHCFSTFPKQMFRYLPARRLSPPRLPFEAVPPLLPPPAIPAGLLSCLLPAFPRTGPLPARPNLLLRTTPGALPSGIRTTIHPSPAPEHTLAPTPSEFHRPRLSHRMLLSIFEHLRLRRFSPASEAPDLREPATLRSYPVQEQPDRIGWRSWITTVRRSRDRFQEVPTRTHPAPKPPPPLFDPRIPPSPPRCALAVRYSLDARPFHHDWNPASAIRHGTFAPSAPPGRFPTCLVLLPEPAFSLLERPSRAPSCHDTQEWLIRSPLPSQFTAPERQLIPAELPGSPPLLHPQPRIPDAERSAHPSSTLIASIAKSRLAPLAGLHPMRPFKSWPSSSFRNLRRLRFNPSAWLRLRLPPAPLPPFSPLVPETVHPIRPLLTPSHIVQRGIPTPPAKGGFTATDRPIGPTPPRAPRAATLSPAPKTGEAAGFHFHPPAPAPAFSIHEIESGIISHTILDRKSRPAPRRAYLASTPPLSLTAPFGTPAPLPTPSYDRIRHPVQPMILLASAPGLRNLSPVRLPRRATDAPLSPRMIQASVALPRRSQTVRNYLLSLETSLTSWQSAPPPRRSRLATQRIVLPHLGFQHPPSFPLPDLFRTVQTEAIHPLGHITPALGRADNPPPPSAHVSIERRRPSLRSIHAQESSVVSGSFSHDAPEWIRLRRLPRLRIRAWPSFYELATATARFAIPPLSVDGSTTAGRSRLSLFPPDAVAASAPGAFSLRHRERVRSPYSLRNPRRWLTMFHAQAEGVPPSYPPSGTILPSHPSRLDTAARAPQAFMGPAFRAPWQDVRREVAPVDPLLLPSLPTSPDRIAFARTSLRPAQDTPRTLPEVPLPVIITLPRPDALACQPPGVSPAHSISSDISLAPSAPRPTPEPLFAVHDTFTGPHVPLLELVPVSMPPSLPTPGRSSWSSTPLPESFPRGHEGSFTARLRNLQFPYSPDTRLPAFAPVQLPADEAAAPAIRAPWLDDVQERSSGIAFAEVPYLPPPRAVEPLARGWKRSERPCPFIAGLPPLAGPHSVERPVPNPTGFRSPPPIRRFAPTGMPLGTSINKPGASGCAPTHRWISIGIARADRDSPGPTPQEAASGPAVPPWRSFAASLLTIPSMYSLVLTVPGGFPPLHAPETHLVILPGRWRRRVADPASYREEALPPRRPLPEPVCEHAFGRFPSSRLRLGLRIEAGPVPAPICKTPSFPLPLVRPLLTGTPSPLPEPRITHRPVTSGFTAGSEPFPRLPAPLLRHVPEQSMQKRLGTRLPALPVHLEIGLRLSPMPYPAWNFADRRAPSKLRGSVPRKAALRSPSLPDWIELPDSRPSCGGCVDLPASGR